MRCTLVTRAPLILLLGLTSLPAQNTTPAPQSHTSEIAALVAIVLSIAVGILGVLKAIHEKKKAALELERVRQQIAEEEQRPTIERIRDIFQHCKCASADVCRDTLCLRHATTNDQAIAALNSLHHVLSTRPVEAIVAATWLQDELYRTIEKARIPTLQPSGASPSVIESGLECYALLMPHLAPDCIQKAVLHARTLINDRTRMTARRETIRNLLPNILNTKLTTETTDELVQIYEGVIKEGRTNADADTRDCVKAAMNGLSAVATLPARSLLRLIKAGFVNATHNPSECCFDWSGLVRQCREGQRLGQDEWSSIAKQVSGYIGDEGNAILQPAREREYSLLCSAIVDAHNGLGISRNQRPKNRHIVEGPAISTTIRRPGTGEEITGILINFSLPQPPWKAGAWVTSNGTIPWLVMEQWQQAEIRIGTSPPIDLRGLVRPERDPNPLGTSYGYRIQFENLTGQDIDALKRLAVVHTLTR